MKTILVPVLLALTSVSSYRYSRQNRPSFLRDSVERITNYPFKTKLSSARLEDDQFRYLQSGLQKSNLVDYLFRSFGTKKLPLRDAVESLPVPILSAEQRSFSGSGRIPLRDAVEHRTVPELWNSVEDEEESEENFRAKYKIEDELNSVQETQGERGRNNGGFHYEISYDLFEQFDPVRYQLLPNGISGYPTPGSGILGPRRPGGNSTVKGTSEAESFLDDDAVEILPERMEDFRSLVRKMGNRNRGKKPWEKNNNIPGVRDPHEYKVVCYLEGWANYRKAPMKFNNLDLDPYACTHIIYAYAAIDPHGFNIYPQDEEHDVVQGGYRSVVGLKRYNPDLKILISIAGWSDGDSKFSMMTSSAARRQKFIRSVARFVDTYEFDGIDLDWEYPGAEDLGGSRKDRENFALLLEELSEVFVVKNWMLSAAVPPSRFRVEDGYDVMQIAKYLDLINVLAFDLHSERDDIADHHSPLFRRDHDHGLDVFYNADYAVQYWLKKGAPRDKLILGIPFFARSFTLINSGTWQPGSEVRGLGREGAYTQEKGFLAYFEVCEKVNEESWTKRTDSVGSPYITRNDQWIGYDDPSSVRNKVNYIKKQQLGGAVLYAVDLDDFKGLCGERWPLLNTVRNGLSLKKPPNHQPVISTTTPGDVAVPTPGTVIVRPGDTNCTGQGYARDPSDCRVYYRCEWGSKTSYICPGNLHFDENLGLCNWPEQARCHPKSNPDKFSVMYKSAQGDDDFKIVCYFTNWAWYRKGDGKFLPEHMDPRLCTHIVYAYASLDPDELKVKPFDVYADIDNSFYDRVTSLPDPRNKNGRATVLLGLGGWTDSTGDKYSRLVSDAKARRDFVSSTIAFLRRYHFAGLHLDWNYPKCWQSNCNRGPDSDMRNFAQLIKELKYEFDIEEPPLILAAGISGYREVIDVAYDVAELSKYLDFMSVMTYDYHGSWEKRTGHVSPLYYRAGDSFPRFNTNYTLEYLAHRGADRRKLLMGIPFYGQSFTLNDEKDNSYGALAEGPGVPGEFTKQPGMLSYYEICDGVRNKNWYVSRDPQGATGPYAYQSDQWVSYDDVDSVKEKAKYIRNLGYGGAMAWTIDLDDFNNKCCRETFPLLKAIGRVLGHISEDEPARPDCTRPTPPITPAPPITTTGVDSGASTEHVHTTWPTWTRPTTTTIRTSTVTKPWWETSTTTTTTTTTRRPTTTTTRRPTTTTTRRPPITTTTTRRPPITTTPPTSIETLTDEPTAPPKQCEPGKYYPDTINCNAYYRCILGEYQKQYCVGGLHWNPEANVCDWPESAKCDREDFVKPAPPATFPPTTTTTTTTKKPSDWWTTTTTKQPGGWWSSTTTTTTIRSTTVTASLENCRNGEYYPVPGACNAFFICVNGRPITQNCAPGLYWNQQQQICDWSHKVKCESDLNKYDQLTKEESKPCESGSYSNFPGDCNRYMSCLWGVYTPFSCAPGLHWNNEEKICDWPKQANCDGHSPGPVEGVVAVGEPGGSGGEIDETQSGSGEVSQPFTTTKRTTVTIPNTTYSPATTVPPPSSTQSGYFKIVCYFTNWAWYRQGEGKYLPENIDPDLCTHIVYGFAVLDYENLVIKAHDSWADFDNKFYERVVAYKKKGLKVTLAIGGWNDSQGDKYSRLVNNPSSRRKFITHVIQFLQKYDFDGLDLDWEYPKCWQVDCKKGPDSDKAAFAAFVREIHEAFQPLGLLLSSAVSPSKTVIDAGYDVPALGRYLDWVAVMTYDFHGQWDKKTGHVAPMHFHEDDEFYFFNANYSINYWISEGVPRRKIVMGMPLYGQSFQLSDAKNNGLNANAPGPGQAGEFTRAAGFLAYYEICDRIRNHGWTVVKDPQKRMGPYAYKGNQWVSFDDVETIKMKSEYIRQMDLGGGMIWALDLDDFKNRCGGGRHPLLSTIRNTLGPARDSNDIVTTVPVTTVRPDVTQGSTSNRPTPTNYPPTVTITTGRPVYTTLTPSYTTQTPSYTTQTPPGLDLTTTPASQGEITTWRPGTRGDFKVVCYFTNWAWYRQGLGKYLPGDIDADLCTHVIYGFAVLNGDQGIIKPHDTWADFDNKFYEKVTEYKKKGIKVLVAIGGWNDSAGDKYSRLVNNPSARARFISHVIEFIENHNFDGLDLDWEYPKCWQVNCKMGPDSDKPAFADFVRELKAAFRPKGLLLSAAVSPSKLVIDSGYDVPTLSKYLDWISVMTYDYHGQWDKITGHVAPMYLHPEDVDVTFNANFSINYWINQGADRKKIVMGMPMYGQSFSLADNQENGLNVATYGGGEAGDFTRARGFLSYYEICHNIRDKGWKVVRDKKGRMGPYAYLRDQWVSFDDQAMIRQKSEFVRDMDLGGGMIWALDLDDFRNRCNCETYPLLKTINRVLRNYPGPGPKCVLDGKDQRKETVTKKPTTHMPSVTLNPSVTNKPLATNKPSITQKPTKQNLNCNGRIFADHPDCNKYYQCQHGTLHVMACPAGLHWNKDHCDWPESSGCHSNSNEILTPTTTSSPVTFSTVKPPPTMTMWPPTTISMPSETPKPETTSHRPLPESDYKVVCYFTNWAWYRQGIGKYTPENIDYELCTHIAYGFAVLDGNSLTIKPHDSWADIDNEFYTKVTNLKNKGIKVLIAIGGWNDSLGDKYSRLVSDPNSRRKFIEHVIQFIEKYNFDGLDLDWEYPKCWQVNCNAGPEEDKENFALFVQELSSAFKPKGWLLSSAVSPSKVVIDLGYDVPRLSQYFDYISVMTYDFHGHWDKATGHVAPLHYYPGDTYDYFNANFSINYWIEKGADRRKIVMGMPLYGQSFQLKDTNDHDLNTPAYGPGQAGEFTRAGGFLAFYEICDYVKKQGWTVVRDPQGRIGPYAYRGNQWVSYDDVSEIRRKSQFVKEMGLGGGMIWALDLDDFRNRCNCGTHPLLKTLNQELRGIGGMFSDCT